MALPPILMIHGMWSRPSIFAALRGELEAVGVSSVAVTLPLHDAPPGSPAPAGIGNLGIGDYVDAVERAAQAIGEPPLLLGHSMGGLLAQKLAARIAHRGLILLATAPSRQAAAFTPAAARTLAGVTTRWGWWQEPTLIGADAARRGIFNGVPEVETRAALAELTFDSGRALRQIILPWGDADRPTQVHYARLGQPALLLVGRDDRIVPPAVSRNTARLLAAAGARVDYEEWPATGHWLFHDATRPRTAAAIARFAASLR